MTKLVALAVAATASACDPNELEWTIQFSEEADAEKVVAAEASIVHGNCDSDDVVYEAPPEEGLYPPKLTAGTYGFRARARRFHDD